MYPRVAYLGMESMQMSLRLEPTGVMDEATVNAVRGLQYVFDLPQTGVVDEGTAEVIGELQWYRGYDESA
jgi:peptidoglycan hydrolase-like protein with peptidoglycan-binding domain